MFKTISVDDGYGNAVEITINTDAISYVEEVGGSPIIHIHGQAFTPIGKSYDDVKTALSAAAL